MSLKDLNLNIKYRSFENDIVEEFYIPILKKSVLYKRAVGFFSSSSLIEISKGISGLINNNGKIQIITSPQLSKEDIDAINKGYIERDKIFEKIILNEIKIPRNTYEEERLNYISHLICNNQLDIKLAFINENNNLIGMYHEKIGIIQDAKGNKIAFTGSLNESNNSFNNNFESIDVFFSWEQRDNERVVEKEKDFDNLWLNKTNGIKVLEFPKIALEKLIQFKKENIFNEKILNEIYLEKEKTIPKKPSDLKLFDYQNEAINAWEKNDFKGIFNMATGTGKTLTGLSAIMRLMEVKNNKMAIIIVCPYQHLIEQWIEDIHYFGIEVIIGYSASKQKDWKDRLKNAIIDYKLNVINYFCFISTNATYSNNFVQENLKKLKGDSVILIDEVHNFGAENLSNFLDEKFQFRLGLTATLERHNDKEGTDKLLNYFKNICIEYDLKRAIAENKLTKYYYYPVICYLDENELIEYKKLTRKIANLGYFDKKEKNVINKQREILLIKRARIIAGAKDKIFKLKEIFYKENTKVKHSLVYCGATNIIEDYDEYSKEKNQEIKQIEEVIKVLGNEFNFKVGRFTSLESIEEREQIKRSFSNGDLEILVAIKCLDEGVNIPEIEKAYILASSTNYKEYVQRRGRVLRKSKGKRFAYIYDFITLPRKLDNVSLLSDEEKKQDISLVKRELERIIEFSEISENPFEGLGLIKKLKEIYKIKLEVDINEF